VTNRPRKPRTIELETDPRFPSGKWTGFWLQRFYAGRQYQALNLTFANGEVLGDGSDRVGEFTMAGSYDLKTGRCDLVKAYIGAHALSYEGKNEGDGKWIWGLWRMTLDRGGFHMWPAGEDDPTGQKLRAQQELPPPQRRRRIKPPPLVEEPAGT
jgi:hypothetical protein